MNESIHRRRNPGFRRSSGVFWLCMLAGPLLPSGCLVERTVTDGSGEVIYQEPEVHQPFESKQKKEREIEAKERELGW